MSRWAARRIAAGVASRTSNDTPSARPPARCQRPVEGHSSTEEGAVTLVSDLGEMALKWIGREAEPGLDRRPRERSRVANELAGEIRRGVSELDACVDAAPIDVERHRCLNGGTIEERVADISVVLDLEVGDMHGGRPAAEVHFHASAVDRYSPEQAALFGAGIEIVNLGRQTDIREDVQSNEGERALPVTAIEADVLAVHEANVRLPEQRAVGLVLARTRSPLADSDEPIEIGDQRRIASAALDRVRGADWVCCREVEVKETERPDLCPARNRPGFAGSRLCCSRRTRQDERGRDRRRSNTGHSPKQLAT